MFMRFRSTIYSDRASRGSKAKEARERICADSRGTADQGKGRRGRLPFRVKGVEAPACGLNRRGACTESEALKRQVSIATDQDGCRISYRARPSLHSAVFQSHRDWCCQRAPQSLAVTPGPRLDIHLVKDRVEDNDKWQLAAGKASSAGNSGNGNASERLRFEGIHTFVIEGFVMYGP
eukprot:755815-Hanusia_phi.AAC.8